MKADILSASRLKAFEICPMKYWALYINEDKTLLQGEPHPSMYVGLAVHKILELVVKAMRKGWHKQWHDPYFFLNMAYKKYGIKDVVLQNSIKLMIERAIGGGYFDGIDNCIGCELPFDLRLNDVQLLGVMDRLDINDVSGKIRIIDIKTKHHAYSSEDEIRNDWQTIIYNLAVRAIYPKFASNDVVVCYWFLRYGKQEIVLTQQDAMVDIEKLFIAKRKIEDCQQPTCNVTKLCRYCEFIGCENYPLRKGISNE